MLCKQCRYPEACCVCWKGESETRATIDRYVCSMLDSLEDRLIEIANRLGEIEDRVNRSVGMTGENT